MRFRSPAVSVPPVVPSVPPVVLSVPPAAPSVPRADCDRGAASGPRALASQQRGHARARARGARYDAGDAVPSVRHREAAAAFARRGLCRGGAAARRATPHAVAVLSVALLTARRGLTHVRDRRAQLANSDSMRSACWRWCARRRAAFSRAAAPTSCSCSAGSLCAPTGAFSRAARAPRCRPTATATSVAWRRGPCRARWPSGRTARPTPRRRTRPRRAASSCSTRARPARWRSCRPARRRRPRPRDRTQCPSRRVTRRATSRRRPRRPPPRPARGARPP
jgi:hypothetical protein